MTDRPLRSDGGGDRRLRWLAAWAFRVYFLALLAGISALGVAWYAGGIAAYAEPIAGLWYGIGGFGAVVLALLLSVRALSE